MPLCKVCGNEMSAHSGTCPFCGSSNSHIPGVAKQLTINLEKDLPSVAEALAKLDREVAAARQRGVKQLELIHGYGSTGSGGAIGTAVRKRLKLWLQEDKIASLSTDQQQQTNPGTSLVEL